MSGGRWPRIGIPRSGGGGGSAPTYIQEAETAWNTDANTVSAVVTASFSVQTNDVLVAIGASSDNAVTLSVSGGSLTWTQRQVVNVASNCWISVWTATATSSTSFAVTFTRTGATSVFYGGNVLTFRGSTGVGASAKTNTTGAPSLGLTTTGANSAIVVANADWNAVDGASRTWRTGAGTLSESSYFRDSAQYTLYAGYHADAGAAGSKTVGLTAPTGQKYAIVAVEVLGA